MNRFTKFLGVGVLSVGILAGAFSISFAADPTPNPQTPGINCPMGSGGGFGFGMGQQGISDPVAQLLNMTPQEIATARQGGKSLAEIAAAKGVSESKLVETMLAAKKSLLSTRVSAGSMTQAQADQAYANMQQQVTQSIQRTTVGPNGNGGCFGSGYGQGQGRGRMGR